MTLPGTIAPEDTGHGPLVTYCLLTYNQERYVRSAVESAFAQTYEPLEIVLSDDASQDASHRILLEMAAAYRGPHRVVVNRNPTNLGTGAHINRVYGELAHGTLLVNAAGDDVSEPTRVADLVDAWLRHAEGGGAPSLLFSNAQCIDAEGRPTGLLVTTGVPDMLDRRSPGRNGRLDVLGCSVAVDRRLVESFPPILDGILAEDVVLARRAYLRSGVLYLAKPLVRYRIHADGLSHILPQRRVRSQYLPHQRRWVEDRRLRFRQARIDIAHANPPDARALAELLRGQERLNDFRDRILNGTPVQGILALLSEMLVTRALPRESSRALLIRWSDFYRWSRRARN